MSDVKLNEIPTGTPSSSDTILMIGTNSDYRATASDVLALANAITSPSSPSSGDFLVYNGTTWVAQSLSTWSGGSY